MSLWALKRTEPCLQTVCWDFLSFPTGAGILEGDEVLESSKG